MKKITLFFVFVLFANTNLLQGQLKTSNDAVAKTAKSLVTSNLNVQAGGILIIEGFTSIGGEIIVQPGGAFTIEEAGSLGLVGDFKIESDASQSGSFIGKTYTGNISYDRYVTDGWHIISSMVTNQSLNAFVENASNDITTNTDVSPTRYALAPYSDNSNSWSYYTATSITSAGDFLENRGYAFKRNNAGTINFTGTHRSADANTTISFGTATGWNSIGNPYPSYIPLNTEGNFITTNAAALDDSYEAGYVWDSTTEAYLPITNASPTRYIAPGQGFMVKSDADGGTISFTEAMQSHQSGANDVFSRTEDTTPRILMEISNSSLLRNTNIAYLENATLGLDPGYDAGVFTDYDFNIYTRLLDNSSTINLHTQALPNSNYENMVIPVGVNADSNTEITIHISASNLPSGIMVFLEDRIENIFTHVDDGSSYTTIHNSNGIGRFYLHTTSVSLNTLDVALSDISIYSIDKTVYLHGLPTGEKTITFYDLLGRVVAKNTFKDTGLYSMVVNKLSKGTVYIVDIATEKGKLSKKIIVQ